LGSGYPYDLAVNATNVYFTNQAMGQVLEVPIDGGASTVLSADSGAFLLALDSTYVYWTTGNAVERLPLEGGIPVVLAPATGSIGIAVDSLNVYLATTGGGSPGPSGTISSLSLDGGAPNTLATSQDDPYLLKLGPDGLYWVNEDISGPSDGGSVMRLRLDAGAPEVLAPWSNLAANALAVDSSNVYWNDSTRLQLMKIPLDGSPAVTLATGLDLLGIAVDSTGVYCADRGAAGITRVPLDGGAPVTIAKSFQLPMRVALDANYVYWSDFANLVLKAPK
jgi:sugar lactone lactonase YvrE